MGADRNILTVIDRIVAEIPEAETSLRARLASVRETASFTAPEAMTRSWRQLASVLTYELPNPPVETWQSKIGRIIRAEEEELAS